MIKKFRFWKYEVNVAEALPTLLCMHIPFWTIQFVAAISQPHPMISITTTVYVIIAALSFLIVAVNTKKIK